jgi:hypothetical protein
MDRLAPVTTTILSRSHIWSACLVFHHHTRLPLIILSKDVDNYRYTLVSLAISQILFHHRLYAHRSIL